MSRQLAQLMSGDVTLESRTGLGSILTVHMPLVAVQAPKQPQAPAIESAPADAKILLAEDNEVNQHVGRRMLNLLGHECITVVADGQQAVRACRQQDFDLILMDCQMPVMDGRAATIALRDAGVNTPVIALTATATSTDRDACLRSGMDDYMSKPIELSVLKEKVQRWLARAGSRPDRSKLPPRGIDFDPTAIARHFNGELAFFNSVRNMFVDTVPQSLEQMAVALRSGLDAEVWGLAQDPRISLDRRRRPARKTLPIARERRWINRAARVMDGAGDGVVQGVRAREQSRTTR